MVSNKDFTQQIIQDLDLDIQDSNNTILTPDEKVNIKKQEEQDFLKRMGDIGVPVTSRKTRKVAPRR